VLRFDLSEPRVSCNSSLPLFFSLTASTGSLLGDRDALLLWSWLRSRGRSWCAIGLDLPGLWSLPLGSLSLSWRRTVGDRDLLWRVTPRSTLPLSLRSSPEIQLSFIATYRAGECCGERVNVGCLESFSEVKCGSPIVKVSAKLHEWPYSPSSDTSLHEKYEDKREIVNDNAIEGSEHSNGKRWKLE
jgi:hypothetical protein